MSLKDIEKKIYKQDQNEDFGLSEGFGFQKKPISRDREQERENASRNLGERLESDFVQERKKAGARRKIFAIFSIAAGVLLLTSAFFLFYFLKQRSFYREKDIVFDLEYPQEVMAGKEEMIKIKIGNYSKTSLKDVNVSFRYPNYLSISGEISEALAKSWNFSEIFSGKSEIIEVPVRIFASEGSAHHIESEIQYTPQNFSSIFKKSREGKIEIGSLPIRIDLDAPSELVSGRKMEYQILYSNISDGNISGLILKIALPSDFSLEESILEGQEKNLEKGEALFGILEAGESKMHRISGRLSGESGQSKIIKIQAGFYEGKKFRTLSSAESSTIIKEPEILLIQEEARQRTSASWGDLLEFKIKVKNTSSAGLAGVKVYSKIEGSAVDFSSLRAQDGAASSGGAVFWDSSGIPEFAYFLPSQEKELSFSFKIKNSIAVKNSSMKNFIVSAAPFASAMELEEEAAGNKVEVKIKSKLILKTLGFHYEAGPQIKNYGPIPPKVGQITTYAIHWQLANWTNDVKNAKARAVLPAGIGWSNNIKISRGNLYFSDITRTITWDIGDISANTGIISPVCEAVFQVSAAPSQSDAGKAVTLLKETVVSGADDFTQESLQSSSPEKTTELREDEKLNSSDYRVVY